MPMRIKRFLDVSSTDSCGSSKCCNMYVLEVACETGSLLLKLGKKKTSFVA